MEYLGVVIEIKESKVFVITDTCEVFCIKKQPGMYQGLEVVFEHSEIIGKINTAKRSAIAAGVAAVLIAVFSFFYLLNSNKIYAYIDIDINTNWEFGVDKETRVVDIKALDKNSEILFDELSLKKKPLEVAIVEMVEELNKTGMIDFETNNKVLITACVKDEDTRAYDKNYEKGLQFSYGKIREELSNRNIEPYFMSIRSEDRKLAVVNNISMGRYSILKLSKEQGIDMDIETLKNSQVDEIVENINFEKKSDNSVQDIDNTSVGNPNIANANPNLNPNTNPNTNPNKEKDDTKDSDNNNSNNDNNYDSIDNNDNDINNYNNNISDEGISADLSIDEISDIDNIEAIESANIRTQKVIEEIRLEVKNNIALETDKANLEISKIKMSASLNDKEKNEKIKHIETELSNRIRDIKRAGNEKAQMELNKLNQKANDLLP